MALPQTGAIVFQLAADAITPQTDNTAITGWTDSVNGATCTVHNAPKYRTNRLNSLPSVEFNGDGDPGSADWLDYGRPTDLAAATDAKLCSKLFVFKCTGTGYGALMSSGAEDGGTFINADGTTVSRFGSNSNVSDIPFAGQSTFGVLLVTTDSAFSMVGIEGLERTYVQGGCIGSAVGLGNLSSASGTGVFGVGAFGGSFAGALAFKGELFDCVVWDVALTPTEALQTMMHFCDKYAQAYPWTAAPMFTCFAGDSITAGVGASSAVQTYPWKCASLLGLSLGQWHNLGIGGANVVDVMDVLAPTSIDDIYALIGKNVRVGAFEWFNQAGIHPGPYNNSVAYIAARRNSHCKVVWGSSTASVNDPDSNRVDYDTAFNTNAATVSPDGYVDLAASIDIGDQTAYDDNPSKFSDGVHLSDSGYTDLADLFEPGLAAISFPSGPAIPVMAHHYNMLRAA